MSVGQSIIMSTNKRATTTPAVILWTSGTSFTVMIVRLDILHFRLATGEWGEDSHSPLNFPRNKVDGWRAWTIYHGIITCQQKTSNQAATSKNTLKLGGIGRQDVEAIGAIGSSSYLPHPLSLFDCIRPLFEFYQESTASFWAPPCYACGDCFWAEGSGFVGSGGVGVGWWHCYGVCMFDSLPISLNGNKIEYLTMGSFANVKS